MVRCHAETGIPACKEEAVIDPKTLELAESLKDSPEWAGDLSRALIECNAPQPEGWHVGRRNPLNVYDGSRSVCQCHNAFDSRRIVAALNAYDKQRAGVRSGPNKVVDTHGEYCHCASCVPQGNTGW